MLIPRSKTIRSDVARVISNHQLKPTESTKRMEIAKFRTAREFLCRNKELIVTRADKGNSTVVMDRKTYITKYENSLNDMTTYVELSKNPTKEIEKEGNDLITAWTLKKFLTVKAADNLKTRNSLIPKIYFLPKIHKEGTPMRPIVSNIKSPTYKLATFCSGVLSNIVGKSDYHVKDTWMFVDKIRGKNVPADHVLVSLDIVSLFTNIPINLAVAVIGKKWGEIKEHSTLDKRAFIKGVQICLNSTCFEFEGSFYKQIFGIAMGSPISPVVANLVLEHLEQSVIKKLPFTLPFYFRYVDDIITCVHRDHINILLGKFNNFHPRIRFTVELEKEGKLSFFDTLVINDHNIVKLDWFHKSTWSGRYLLSDCK